MSQTSRDEYWTENMNTERALRPVLNTEQERELFGGVNEEFSQPPEEPVQFDSPPEFNTPVSMASPVHQRRRRQRTEGAGPSSSSSSNISRAWEIFTRIENDPSKVVCTVCGRKMSYSRDGSTSSLNRHYDRHVEKGEVAAQAVPVSFRYDPVRERNLLNDFVIGEALPFNLVESPLLHRYIREGLCPEAKPISRTTVRRDALRKFEEGVLILKEEFAGIRGRISLTTDIWSARSRISFCGITAHWIDQNWLMQKRIISFKRLPYPHDANTIAAHILEQLTSYGIANKIFSIGMDNASANNVAMDTIKAALNPSFEGVFLHTRCACHILNLAVKDGLEYIKDSVAKIREGVEFICGSNKRWERWMNHCESCGVTGPMPGIDVQHRWNSTYKMIKRVLNLKDAFTSFFLMRGRSLGITDEEWENVAKVKDILGVFYKSTVILSAFYTPTANEALGCLFAISCVMHKYRYDTTLRNFVEAATQKLLDYWGNVPMIYLVGLAMDPTYKIEDTKALWKTYLQNMGLYNDDVYFEYKTNAFEVLLQSMFQQYKSVFSRTDQDMFARAGPSSSPTPKMNRFWRNAARRVTSRQHGSESNDWVEYLAGADAPRDRNGDVVKGFDVLLWWKANETRWPALAAMARDVLAVPMSTVASESAFSGAGKIVNESRSRLTQHTTEVCVCLQDWIRAENRTQDRAKQAWLAQPCDDESIDDLLAGMDIGDNNDE